MNTSKGVPSWQLNDTQENESLETSRLCTPGVFLENGLQGLWNSTLIREFIAIGVPVLLSIHRKSIRDHPPC